MKKDIHPKYNAGVKVQCICGNEFEINSTVKGPVRLDSCPACHKTYTGVAETKVIKGRMEKFLEKQKKIESIKNK